MTEKCFDAYACAAPELGRRIAELEELCNDMEAQVMDYATKKVELEEMLGGNMRESYIEVTTKRFGEMLRRVAELEHAAKTLMNVMIAQRHSDLCEEGGDCVICDAIVGIKAAIKL